MFHFFKRNLRHYYVSPLDLALSSLRKKRPQTPSQKYESEKHLKVMQLRDKPAKNTNY
ncbi:CBU_0585 family protein [Candidatus Synchoanobacter obligatus]|uniref:CBU_0585 family protein n=1 Tax=Candidatus Synchoanobacter obligatus TaxID=2919597 RepID=UPI003CC62A73